MKQHFRFLKKWNQIGLIYRSEYKPSMLLGFVTTVMFLLMFVPIAEAQVEDTTRTERRVPERIESNRYNSIINIPYNMSITPSGMSQYRINDSGTRYGFYRRLNFQGAEEFLLSEDERYNPYGSEFERELNERLMAILQEIFKEQSDILRTLSRIAPFLGFGFFERYELPPPPRIEDPDLVPVEN